MTGNLLRSFQRAYSKEGTNEKQSFKMLNEQKSIKSTAHSMKFTVHNSFYLFF